MIGMLVENVNMQMEAEHADLIDRQQIALFGAASLSDRMISKAEVTQTTGHLKQVSRANLHF